MKAGWMLLGAVCALVIGVYALGAHSGYWESLGRNSADSRYNLLVQGFRAGQLSLKTDVPPGLAQLVDPYDPVANRRYRYDYRMHDLSYYKGKLYLYFGVTPALILLWPFAALTGHYLFQKEAVVIFCAIGFLSSVGLLYALWRRYFTEVSVAVAAACALALGLATGVPVMLSRCDVYEVSISCGYMLTMLALTAIWRALHEPERRGRWLAAASLAYGLAVGARPSLLLGAVVLLVPVARARGEHRRVSRLLLAATGPIVLIGLGLMLYNALRFDDPFEFGFRYQLAADHQHTGPSFSLDYLWFNIRIYFLEPARWCGRFPFVREIALPPLPAGRGTVETPFGVLTNIPLVWLALGAPLAWRGRPEVAGTILRWFTVVVALLFWICALTIALYFGACFRYEVEFLPALLLLAAVGILGLERALAPSAESGPACRPVLRWAARSIWCLLLGFSVAFNLLVMVEQDAGADNYVGIGLEKAGRAQEAMVHFQRALRLRPEYPEAQNHLAWLLATLAPANGGDPARAVTLAERLCQATGNQVAPHLDTLAAAYAAAGRFDDAVATAQKAAELARSAGQAQVVKEIESHLQLYRSGHAYRR